ncbi:hypothetical protein EMIHUDRAFT_447702 [Emiliania huxleyi CCMP1516]|uniref:Mannosyltransferase n=2 Tax=Emiliania huxleyi TaxID=2903 RepID=A0A0D3JH75_EMIH1|nr:hypothetical protein EMIHUDRAFT_447702 [Emiliania huxleyi CCMP1516]EOD22860.1 hypothetical protein EMIHUDRAFT_447702 [Emiliania huxleyi CCMP1516]|eukprot:XP_005775289.1 hypothetical protein EMIHUDRAFT_447702 [Emiliania huxleyi CCMP1516]
MVCPKKVHSGVSGDKQRCDREVAVDMLPSSGERSSETTALTVFTLALSHCLALQVAKDVGTLGLAVQPQRLWTALLAGAVCYAHVRPWSSRSLFSLAAAGLGTLCAHGSQSNHVIVEMALAAGVLLTAPLAALVEDASTASARAARREWLVRLASCVRAQLSVLYASAALAKLNSGWFDPASSCCVQMTAAMLGGWLPAWPRLLHLLPAAAIAFEVGFPLALGAASFGGGGGEGTGRRSTLRALMVSGASFHAAIALPPPPLSVYPFTMLMVPFYVVGLLPEELGVLWSTTAFGSLACAALLPPPRQPPKAQAALPPATAARRAASLLPAACLGLLAAMPLLGVRTHPSLAMFSNLDVGGGASNHWLPHAAGLRLPEWLVPSEYTADAALLLLETDHGGLAAAQVNLAPLLPAATRGDLRAVNACARFYISPPSWRAPPTEPLAPFGLPLVEVRRRLSAQPGEGPQDFYLRYREIRAGAPVGPERLYRRRAGVRTAESDQRLDAPLPPIRALLHRFRAFDVEGNVCRH